ncbi:tRNA (adenosine(37)-N6)-threonylcarbamoyltransferase complex ATPase subunit type 1 TsaE [Marinovum sp.]|uniref:tRNA (adenosine(37)-N6)-threonylcarbamoyltransferase complex ATPase subunit type 1 TsaE n=1 Tax=Marinovum sp. TaxID=2024839 RepID=UPI002B26AD10|nr:tRNA (adenosine(37)-N6)-threonylcarbamoyltransferase complex ATPase subunit type 1 TsaE [Marinovum sp.]
MTALQMLTLSLTSPEATCRFATRLGARLMAGDVVLLDGDIGAGKTHFSRCLIQSRLPRPEDVPSPTFTLVQTYETGEAEIWHADLYRLGDVSEVEELGLTEAFGAAICLIEWPDRLGPLTPGDALHLTFAPGPDDSARTLTLSWSDPRWNDLPGALAA